MNNTVILVGRLVRDIELRYTSNGKPVCDFSLAVSRDKEKTDFINIQVWNKLAETLNKYTEKGDMIGVRGSIRHDVYEKDGNKRSKDYILVQNIMFLSTKKSEDKKETNTNNKHDNTPYEEMGREVEQESINLYPENDLPF